MEDAERLVQGMIYAETSRVFSTRQTKEEEAMTARLRMRLGGLLVTKQSLVFFSKPFWKLR